MNTKPQIHPKLTPSVVCPSHLPHTPSPHVMGAGVVGLKAERSSGTNYVLADSIGKFISNLGGSFSFADYDAFLRTNAEDAHDYRQLFADYLIRQYPILAKRRTTLTKLLSKRKRPPIGPSTSTAAGMARRKPASSTRTYPGGNQPPPAI